MKILLVMLMVKSISPSENVGENLLKRIHTTIHEPKNNGNRFEVFHRPIVSVLERTRSRQQQLLGSRSQSRSHKLEPKRKLLLSGRNQLLGGECQAFKTENRILKQQLLAVQKQLQQLERRMGLKLDQPIKALHLLSRIQEDSNQDAGPLDRLLQTGIEAPLQLTSSLITPTPTISTILETTSFVTTVTETMTRELLVNFHGKKLPTQILDTEIHVEMVTSVLSSTIQITPTPSYITLTVTPTVSQTSTDPVVSKINDLLAKQKQEQERKDLLNKIRSMNGLRLEEPRGVGRALAKNEAIGTFESFQAYLQNILQFQPEENLSNFPKTYKSIPTASISTVYISGSVPGQFSTSVITINPYEDVQPSTRKKRDISPSPPGPIVATQFKEIREEDTENAKEMFIVSPSRMDLGIDDGSDVLDYNTVTVTITVSGVCSS